MVRGNSLTSSPVPAEWYRIARDLHWEVMFAPDQPPANLVILAWIILLERVTNIDDSRKNDVGTLEGFHVIILVAQYFTLASHESSSIYQAMCFRYGTPNLFLRCVTVEGFHQYWLFYFHGG